MATILILVFKNGYVAADVLAQCAWVEYGDYGTGTCSYDDPEEN